MYSRRDLLGVATVVAASAAGCTGALGDDGARGGDPDGVRLEELSVQNAHDESHRVQIAIDSDGEMLHLGTYELDANDESRSIDGEWTDTPGNYRIHASLDGGAVQTADVADGVGSDTDCVRVLLRINTGGELAVWTGTNCGPDAEDSDLKAA